MGFTHQSVDLQHLSHPQLKVTQLLQIEYDIGISEYIQKRQLQSLEQSSVGFWYQIPTNKVLEEKNRILYFILHKVYVASTHPRGFPSKLTRSPFDFFRIVVTNSILITKRKR